MLIGLQFAAVVCEQRGVLSGRPIGGTHKITMFRRGAPVGMHTSGFSEGLAIKVTVTGRTI